MTPFPADHQRNANSLACRNMERASVSEAEASTTGDGHERTSASEAKDRAGESSSHGKTANNMKALFANLRRLERELNEYINRYEARHSQPDP